MGLAYFTSIRSHDSETKVGCVIVNEENNVVSMGYNGFPKGLPDLELPNKRPEKYPFMVHAEENAVSNIISKSYNSLKVYLTHFPCHRCAKLLWQKGIKKWYLIPPGTPGLLEGASEKKKICFKKDIESGFGGWCSFSRLDHILKWLNSSSYKNISHYVSNCIQHPEETIFLPNGWGHATINLEPTLAIAQEFAISGSETWYNMDKPVSYVP